MNSVAALAYHFSLALLATFTQPGDHLFAEPCDTHRSLDERGSVELVGGVLLARPGGVDLVPRERLPLRLGRATALAVRRGPETMKRLYLKT